MNVNDKLNQVFEVTGEIVDEVTLPSTYPKPVDNKKEDIDADYEYARNNLHLLIDKGNTAIEGILQLAREGENARSYEVAGQLIKQVADVTNDLMKLQKTVKELNKEEQTNSPKNVTNALFVGSTADLQKMIKDARDAKGTLNNE